MNKAHPFQGLFEPFPAESFVISNAPVSVPEFAKQYGCPKYKHGESCTLALSMRSCATCVLLSTTPKEKA